MIPGVHNLTIRKGEDYASPLIEVDLNGTVLNLTGYTVEAQLRVGPKRTATKIVDFSVAVTNGAVTGYPSDIRLSLTDVQTAAIEQYKGYYDIAFTDAGGDVKYYVEGGVTIRDSVTVPA